VDRENAVGFVVVLVLGAAILWYLLREPEPVVTPAVTTRNACGNDIEKTAAAVSGGVAAAKGVKIDPSAICTVLASVQKGATSIAQNVGLPLARTIGPVVKPIGTAAGSVGTLLTGSNSYGTPVAQLDCGTLTKSCQYYSAKGPQFLSQKLQYCNAAKNNGC